MLRLNFIRRGALLPVMLSLVALAGCINDTYIPEDRTDRTPRELRVTHQVGGIHHCGLLHGGTWFVSQGTTLLSIDPRTGRIRSEESVVPIGSSGAIVDMTIWREDLLVVLEETGLARIDLRSGRQPVTVEVIDAARLGIQPRSVSVVDDMLYISGVGGVVRLPDMKRFLQGSDLVGRVVATPSGPVAPVGRRVVRLDDGAYAGAATMLEPLPPSIGIDGGLAFVLQSRDGATIGLMGGDIREIASEVVPGFVRRLRVLEGHLWAVTDSELVAWRIKGRTLGEEERFPLKGGADIDAINENYFAVVGSFGRAILRKESDTTGPGDDFLRVTRVPGRMDLALTDQRTWIGSSAEGTWRYALRGKPELIERKVEVWGVPSREASANWGTAKLAGDEEDFRRVEISAGFAGAKGTWTAPDEGRIWVVTVVDGDLWIGHDRGIAVLRARTGGVVVDGAYPVVSSPARGVTSSTSPLVEIGSVTLEGPVFNIAPLRTGQGVSFVSRWGGFGVVEWVIPSSKQATLLRPT
ncbi:MAG: hypothetical protein KF724_05110 [Phycisphaeraceae bacterium]|nr:hypothetical protein [Phycisphaeraceae bacterium]